MIKKEDTFKLPRLYTPQPLNSNGLIELEPAQAHYLFNVMRKKAGDDVRLFNGKDGEWLCKLDRLDKKNAVLIIKAQLLEQPQNPRAIHLFFTPIKKNRQDWLIEKAVELGVTDFHPILTQNTEVRKLNTDRVTHQIFEAAEQCERLTIPTLYPLEKVDASLDQDFPILSCLERYDAPPLQSINTANDIGILIGPEGGFTREEKEQIAKKTIPVSLGETVLRCETATVKSLVLINS